MVRSGPSTVTVQLQPGSRALEIVQVVVLALIRGLAEFLPVDPAGHFLLVSRILGWPAEGVIFLAAAQLGMLVAVLVYFWRDVGNMLYGLVSPLLGRIGDETRLFWNVVIATVPLAAAFFLLTEIDSGGGDALLDYVLRNPVAIGAAAVIFAILLWLADALAPQAAQLRDLGLLGALFIGIAQVLALIPGASRAGIAITAGRLLGLERDEAARFSFLLAIPATAGIAILIGREVVRTPGLELPTGTLVALAVAFVAAIGAIALVMAWVRRGSYLPFVIYRLLLGAVLIYWFFDPAGAPSEVLPVE
jgi:undecaprenyl-diphosphatase